MSNKGFLVTWQIDGGDATSAVDAARYALEVMRDPQATAVIFTVENLDTGEQAEVDFLYDPPAVYAIGDSAPHQTT